MLPKRRLRRSPKARAKQQRRSVAIGNRAEGLVTNQVRPARIKQLTDANMKKGDFDSFLMPNLLVKRADTYLRAGDFRRAIADYQRTASGFDYGRKTVDRWHLVSKGNQELYIDSETAEFDNQSLPKFWVKLVDTKPTAKGAYTVEQFSVDCRLKKIKIHSVLKYDSEGKVLDSNDNETGWESTVPDSLGELLYKGMCQ